MTNRKHLITSLIASLALFCSYSQATIISGNVVTGSGSFVELTPGFTDSNPDNTVGNNTFQNTNLYGFNEDQNTEVLNNPLAVDILSTGGSGSLSVGTIVASHYIFFDPAGGSSQTGWVDFDADILAIVTSTNNLLASDYLANTGVNYLNPTLRGLESGDSVSIDNSLAYRMNVDWYAATPGDYVRVLTAYSPGANVPEPGSFLLLSLGLAGLAYSRKRAKTP